DLYKRHAEGCVLAECKPGFAAVVALKCETDFVAKNESFRALTKEILDAAVAASAKTLDEVKALKLGDRTVEERITDEIGKTGEKMELGAYECIAAPSVAAYEHLGNKLATIVGLSQEGIDAEVGREVAMQVAAMNPLAVSRETVAQEVIDEEVKVAVEKTKAEQVQKAVEVALKKAGLNPNHFDSEDHIASNITKGWLTEEDAEKGRKIMEETAAQKAANLPEAMIQNIANGRLNKFFKENTLMEQEYHRDAKLTIAQYLDGVQKGLTVVEFKRVNLNQD
ncbi:MAG: translation elongation factor Ts, partial [Muribaculaceae bacterium]|nr:translation elongation factor Ts [Muribaculaceae bacterium]